MIQKITPRYFVNKTISNPNQLQISYQLRKIIGEGSQGYVYEAIQINQGNFEQSVAIKIQFKKNENEIQIINFLMQQSLHYVIKFFDQFAYQNYYVQVMQLGTFDLYHYLIKWNQTEDQRINLCKKISFCVKEFHQFNFIHCDIKPESFLLIEHHFKLCDMGFVRQENQDAIQNIGTPAFQALEMVESNTVGSNKVDIWSLGCVFFEVMTKDQLFQGNNIKEEIQNYGQNQSLIHQKIQNSKLPNNLAALIISMISIKHDNRPNIDQVIQELENLGHNQKIVFENTEQVIDWS